MTEDATNEITPYEEKALEEVKKHFEVKSTKIEGLQYILPFSYDKMEDVNSHFLQFCAAKDFNVQSAVEMIQKCYQWRRKNVTNDLLSTKFPFVTQLRTVYPHNYHGVDKDGCPLYFDRIGKCDAQTLESVASLPDLVKFWVLQYEYYKEVVLPACSIAAKQHIAKGITIVDASGLGLKHMKANSRKILQLIMEISREYYPEMCKHTYIINASVLFHGIWTFVKTIMPAKACSRVTVLGTNYSKDLLKHIEADQIPECFGGTRRVTAQTNDPSVDWCFSPIGPWKDPKILEELKRQRSFVPAPLFHAI